MAAANLRSVKAAVFSRMPLWLLHHLSLYPSLALWSALRLGLSHIEYLRLLRRLSFYNLRHIVFDQMLPRLANYWPRATVEQLMHDAGLEDVRLVWVNEISWSAVGIKPRGNRAMGTSRLEPST
jgi:hypothetical protein